MPIGPLPLRLERWDDALRKLIEFDDDTFDKLKQLARDRMGTLQELADEAFADLLKKHGIPIDLKDALRKSAAGTKGNEEEKTTGENRKTASRRKSK
jgi:predicted transcriptional regulator